MKLSKNINDGDHRDPWVAPFLEKRDDRANMLAWFANMQECDPECLVTTADSEYDKYAGEGL